MCASTALQTSPARLPFLPHAPVSSSAERTGRDGNSVAGSTDVRRVITASSSLADRTYGEHRGADGTLGVRRVSRVCAAARKQRPERVGGGSIRDKTGRSTLRLGTARDCRRPYPCPGGRRSCSSHGAESQAAARRSTHPSVAPVGLRVLNQARCAVGALPERAVQRVAGHGCPARRQSAKSRLECDKAAQNGLFRKSASMRETDDRARSGAPRESDSGA